MDSAPDSPAPHRPRLPLEGLIALCLQSPEEELAPRRLGDYELFEELGRGGMGVVYRAQHVPLGRAAAVKVLPGGVWARADFAARFRQEAQLAARLRHPHIVTVYETGGEDGTAFYAMELVTGPPLHEGWSATGDWKARAVFMAKVARAIAHAHDQGVLHRDLKPSNILRDAAGEPRVSDFGLACLAERDHSLTLSMDVLGSPAYMAPEQGRGKAGGSSTAVDVYALGGVLYFLLTGRPPFMAGTLSEILAMVRSEPPLPPRRLNTAIPRDLETIALHCLEKEPARRYASASALAEDLERFVAGKPVQARPVSAAARAWRWCRRHPAVAVLSTLLLLTAAAAVWRIAQAREAAESSAMQARARLRESLMSEAQARLLTSGIPRRHRAMELLRAANEIHSAADTQDTAITALAQPDLKILTVWETSGNAPVMAVDAEHRFRGFVDSSGAAVLESSRDNTIAARVENAAHDFSKLLHLSGDGRMAVLTVPEPQRFRIIRWSDGATLLETAARKVDPAGPAAFLLLDDGGHFRLWTEASGLSAPWTSPSAHVLTAISADGQHAAWLTETHSLVLADARSGTVRHTVEIEYKEPTPLALAISASGEHVAVVDADSVRIYESRRGLRSRIKLPGFTPGAAFSQDGRYLALTGPDVPLRLYDWRAGGRPVAEWALRGQMVQFGNEDRTLLILAPHQRGGWLTELSLPLGLHPVSELETSAGQSLPGRGAAAFDPGGRFLLTAGGSGIAWHRSGDGALLAETALPGVLSVSCAAGHVVAGTATGAFSIPLMETAEEITAGQPRPLWSGGTAPLVSISPDGRTAAVWCRVQAKNESTLRLFDLAEGREIAAAGPYPVQPASLEWSPDGRWLAGSVEMNIKTLIWDGRLSVAALNALPGEVRFPRSYFPSPFWSPAGNLLVPGLTAIHERLPGAWQESGVSAEGVINAETLAMALVADGTVAVIAQRDGSVRLLSWPDRKHLAGLTVPPEAPVHTLRFSSDGARLAMVCTDGRVLLWNIAESAAETARQRLRGPLHDHPWREARTGLPRLNFPVP